MRPEMVPPTGFPEQAGEDFPPPGEHEGLPVFSMAAGRPAGMYQYKKRGRNPAVPLIPGKARFREEGRGKGA